MEREIEGCKPEARQSILLQCLNPDDASRPFAIDWHAYDLAFEEAGSMHPLLRHEVDLWLKTVWGVLKPFEERLTLDDFKCVLLALTPGQGEAAAFLRDVLLEHPGDCPGKGWCLQAQSSFVSWSPLWYKDLLVETNPTGHVEADGFFSRFLLVQQSAQRRMSKKKNVKIGFEALPAAAAGQAVSVMKHSPSLPNQTPVNLPNSSPLPPAAHTRASQESPAALEKCEEEGTGSPTSSKLTLMQHRTQPSWSSSTQPGANQVTLAHMHWRLPQQILSLLLLSRVKRKSTL